MIAGLLDHLWQSTLFAAGAGLLAWALRRNGARIRFWLWFAASMKFLLPFCALAALGAMAARLHPVVIAAPHILALQPAAEPFLVPTRLMAVGAHHGWTPWLGAAWALGLAAIMAVRLMRWSRLGAILRDARDIAAAAPVRVKASASLLEPGLVGILRPTVLLPAGLMARLSRTELDAILAHEVTHLRNRDNLTAALHMLVEALFWFWPPVWLIGARLIAAREQACDEMVLAQGHDAETYAGSILKVCRFCIQSPLACASGASGADLGRRVARIMTGDDADPLSSARILLLAGAATAAITLPVMAGFVSSPLVAEVQRRTALVQARIGEAAARMVAAPLAAVLAPPAAHKAAAAPLPRPVVHVMSPPLPQPPPVAIPLPPDPGPARPASPVPAAASPLPSPEQFIANALRHATLALSPIGNGDPNAITCRAPQVLPGSRLPGPTVCKFNRVWAQLKAGGLEISPDGTYLFGGARTMQALASHCYAAHPALMQGPALDAAIISACR